MVLVFTGLHVVRDENVFGLRSMLPGTRASARRADPFGESILREGHGSEIDLASNILGEVEKIDQMPKRERRIDRRAYAQDVDPEARGSRLDDHGLESVARDRIQFDYDGIRHEPDLA